MLILPPHFFLDFEESKKHCPYSKRVDWWFNLLELSGKWYATNPPLATNQGQKKAPRVPIDVLREAPPSLLHSGTGDIVRLTSLAYK